MIFADLETVERRIGRLAKKAQSGDKDAKIEITILEKLKATLEANKSARTIDFSKEEMVIVKQYTLLTMKPIIYVANLGEEDLEDPSSNPHYNKVVEFAAGRSEERRIGKECLCVFCGGGGGGE